MLRPSCFALLVVVSSSGALHAAESKMAKPFVPEFEFPAPLAALTTAAIRSGLPLEGIAPPLAEGSGLQPGDQVTALVSLLKDGDLKQWAIEVRCVELNEQEKQKPLLRTWTLYTNVGTTVFLSAQRAVLAVRILGPFERTSRESDADKHAVEKKARIVVNADFLSLGLDRACEAVMAINAAKKKDPALAGLNWSVRLRPFPATETAVWSKVADSLGLTPERERAVAGANPALREFFQIVSGTPGLQEIMKGAIDVPWWTIIKKGGDAPIALAPQYGMAAELAAGASPLAGLQGKGYTLPFFLFIGGKPALVGRMAVVNPQRPLLASAGIMGVAACAPDGTGPRVMLQILSARPGGAK